MPISVDKATQGVEKASSPSPVIDSVAKNSWNATDDRGTPQQALNTSFNKKTVNPESMKK